MITSNKSILMKFRVKKNTKKSSYYQADMNFKLGFSKAIDLGRKQWQILFRKIRTE
jgi:hypothetical protein